ncbi:hypothetical protein [Tomitella biformata]|uniref:hypothetical protein n=1 Tax=Tomitella biformata TaxID=630403 RepID=UPI0004B38249|nr:hypothetical protein [Tomitella biformata]
MRRNAFATRSLTLLAATALAISGHGLANAAPFGPLPPANPFLGPVGTATMHGDAESSDTTPSAGPGTGAVDARYVPLLGACPTILQGSDEMPMALCTNIIGREPVVHLLDPATGASIASLTLTKGSLLGGVYAYVDDQDRMVMVDGNTDMLRIGHSRGGDGAWRLTIDSETPLADPVTGHCGGGDCDAVNSLMPDRDGNVWLASALGVVGVVAPDGTVRTKILAGEQIANSISTAAFGTAVTTDHATYLFTADSASAPTVVWRAEYDRGTARKPGQLSWGSGASPTFFGPEKGNEYLAITDNADAQESLIVYRSATGETVCEAPIFTPGSSGTEDSPVGSGNSVFLTSTYGYPYPALPEGAGPSSPAMAPIAGGMTRIDVNAAGDSCETVWENDIHSSAVPRLSLADGLLYTITRDALFPNAIAGSADLPIQEPMLDMATGVLDSYSYTAIDAGTGEVRARQQIGASAVVDTLEMVGMITPDRVMYQGTITGLLRIAPR